MPSARNKAYVLAIRPNAKPVHNGTLWSIIAGQQLGKGEKTAIGAWRNAAEYLRNKYAGDQTNG